MYENTSVLLNHFGAAALRQRYEFTGLDALHGAVEPDGTYGGVRGRNGK
ncbi:MAG: hypothetical protein LBH34_05760 [Prevotellaceae bacterium]|nr:hypothetical protein [Prevotellaceae bacterium]